MIRLTGGYKMEGGPQTATQIAMKRQTFWESRVTGSTVVWQNLKLAAEALLNSDVELAETALQAAEIRLQASDLSLCYDMTGQSYEIPAWVYRDPTNLVSEEEMRKLSHSVKRSHEGPVEELHVKIRLSASSATDEQDIPLVISTDMTGGAVKDLLQETLLSGRMDQKADPSTPKPNLWSTTGGLPPAKMRLLFRGRILDDDCLVQEARISDGDIVQVFIKVF